MTASILDAYRLPQLVQGWEWGLLRFLRARVTSEPPTRTAVMSAVTWPSCLAVLGMCCRQHCSNLQHHCDMCTKATGSEAPEACLVGEASTVRECMGRMA